jgi:glycosyltransferase involved in cell wall biosynthesis
MNLNLNLMAPINPLSYGLVGWNILRALVDNGVNVSLFPIDIPNINDKQRTIEWHMSHISKDPNYINQLVEQYLVPTIQNKCNYDRRAPTLRIFHQHLLHESVGYGRRVGFPIFELDKFAPHEINSLNGLHQIFVCSRWAADVLNNCKEIDVNNYHIIPLGVDRDIFNENIRPEPSTNFRDPNVKTVFYLPGKLEIRKSHDIIHEIFADAFNENDSVELWLTPHSFFVTQEEMQEWLSLYKNSELGSKIKILPRFQTQVEIAQVMSQVDCVLSISKAEGWDLPCLEAMAMGKLVIATNYSGHTEFCTEENCYLIDIDEVEPAYDGKFFFNQGNWAHIGPKQKNDIITCMKHIHSDISKSVNQTISQRALETSKRFSWENTADQLISSLF